MKLGAVFDPRSNALNAWRLVLATEVILWHSWPLTGNEVPIEWVKQLGSQVPVDAFFAVSGFLITSSWMRKPHLRQFAAARALRIFPGLWVCLLVTAFLIAPISVLVQRGSVWAMMSSGSPVWYVIDNALLYPFYVGIDGTPKDVPWPGVWNGSLWTLLFEMVCYVAVAILGATGLLKRSATIPVAFGLSLCLAAVVGYPVFAMTTIPQMISRFAVTFAAGALVYQYRDKIPANWTLVGVGGLIVVLSGFTGNYRLIGAVPLAYVVIVSGSLLKHRRLNLRNDLSYGVYIYAFPIQQLLMVAGVVLHPALFFVVATAITLPLAAGSWFVVEKRALALKSRVSEGV